MPNCERFFRKYKVNYTKRQKGQKIEEITQSIDNQLSIARNLISEQNFNKARKFLEELIKLAPHHIEINYLLGQLYEIEGNYLQASYCFEKLLQMHPTDEFKYRIAQCFMDAERYQDAFHIFEELYQVCDDINIFEQYAHTASILGYKTKAWESYNKILEIDRNNLVALFQLSEVYYQTDDQVNHHLTKAKINYLENLLSNCTKHLKKTLNHSENEGQTVDILFNLAKVLEESGKYFEAIEQYNYILNFEPPNEVALSKIESLSEKLTAEENSDSLSFLQKCFKILSSI